MNLLLALLSKYSFAFTLMYLLPPSEFRAFDFVRTSFNQIAWIDSLCFSLLDQRWKYRLVCLDGSLVSPIAVQQTTWWESHHLRSLCALRR